MAGDFELPKDMVPVEDLYEEEPVEYPFGTKYHFYELDGMPIRQESKFAVPQILGKTGWELWPHMTKLMYDAEPIDEAVFNRLVEANGGDPSNKGGR